MNGPPPSTDQKTLIAALAEQARSDAPERPVPEPEELLDYLAGRLAPEDEQRIARQLAADPAAARALLDLAEIEAAGAEAGERPTELSAVAGWREFRSRLPGAPPRPHRLSSLLPAIAASLLVATLGLGSWAWRLWSGQHRPIPNLVSLVLTSDNRAADEQVFYLKSEDPFRLVLDGADYCPSYAAEVEGPQSRDRQTIEGLERDKGGALTALLQLKSGSYRLRLLGCEPRRLVEEYRFQIKAVGRGGPER